MGTPIFLSLASICLAANLAADRPEPGWADVFINLPNYDLRLAPPIVGAGEPPKAYRQTGSYGWTGGRLEVIDVTLARDPEFKDKYAAATLKKDKNPPTEREINKKKAFDWKLAREEGKLEEPSRRLVVVLAADKAIIIEQKGFGADLAEVAKRFDFAKVEKALDQPPRRKAP